MSDHVHPTASARGEQRPDAHPRPVSRRRFLQRSAMTVAGATLFSCTGGRIIPSVSDDPTAAIDTGTPIKRVIYLMLENRSFNNVFGRFPGVKRSLTGVEYGVERPLFPCPDWLPGDLPHDRAAYLNCVHGGEMDGFGNDAHGVNYSYSVFQEHQIPNYWLWAREYALSDNFFASAAGPSYANHFYFVAGQSGGVIDNPENIQTRFENGTTFKSWGCDAYGDGVFVFVKDEHGNLTKHNTCFTFKTVGEQLSEAGVDWAFYAADPHQPGYFWNAYNGISGVFHNDELWHRHIRSVDSIVPDIQANRLPPVTWVTPRFELSDHPPYSTGHSHNWVSDIVNAVMRSPAWKHTAIFLTWDEWGGFYDPVLPPEVDPIGLGIRVPLLTISPYTRRGLIDTKLGEFSTPLKFVSDNWGLDYLTPRIANTHGFEHVFDFKANPRAPVIGTKRAPAYGDAFGFPTGFDGWRPGTIPDPGDFI